MFNQKSFTLGNERSVIRDIFEYSSSRKAEIGEQNVFDFSLGNPCIAPPKKVTDTLSRLLAETDPIKLHGYSSAAGIINVRQAISDSIFERFQKRIPADLIYLSCGAAAGLVSTFGGILSSDDEVVVLAPYFPEYKVFCEGVGAKFIVVESNKNTFKPDLEKLSLAINKNTKAVILNYPNNPSGVVLSKQEIQSLCSLLAEKQNLYSHPIYVISDEPYRELTFDSKPMLFAKYYDNTITCYSFSKSLSLPGERIGYVAVNPEAYCSKEVFLSICGKARQLGYVCAPVLFQNLIKECVNEVCDIEKYRKNRDTLFGALTEMGYSCVHPDGAFYLFVRSPIDNAVEFCNKAKEYELMLVPSDSFGVNSYVRIAYCVSPEQIENSLPAFKNLISNYL